jgi:guanylate kinase
VDGRDYRFLSDERFQELRRQDALLECKEVFRQGFWYGTLREEVSSGLSAGKWVVLEIDVEGMQAVVEQHPDAVTIFLRPSTLDELERRLRGRGTESEEAIRRRLEVARRELDFADRYRHQVINDSADQAVAEICEILRSQGE